MFYVSLSYSSSDGLKQSFVSHRTNFSKCCHTLAATAANNHCCLPRTNFSKSVEISSCYVSYNKRICFTHRWSSLVVLASKKDGCSGRINFSKLVEISSCNISSKKCMEACSVATWPCMELLQLVRGSGSLNPMLGVVLRCVVAVRSGRCYGGFLVLPHVCTQLLQLVSRGTSNWMGSVVFRSSLCRYYIFQWDVKIHGVTLITGLVVD